MVIDSNAALTNLDGLSGLTSVGGNLSIRFNAALRFCSCGLDPLLSSGGVAGSIFMSDNAAEGDCNNNGADISAAQCLADGPGPTLIADIEALVADDDLMESLGNALINKIEGAIKQAEKGNIQAAINKLEAFITQVENLLAVGQIAESDADALIAAAEAMIALLS